MLYKILLLCLDMVAPLMIGFVLRLFLEDKLDLETWKNRILMTGIVLFAPPLAMISIWEIHLSSKMVALPIIGLGMQVTGGLAGFLYSKYLMEDEPQKEGAYFLAGALSNRGVLGSLTVFILFGEMAYGYARLVVILGPVFLYGLCFPTAQSYFLKSSDEESEGISIVNVLLNPKQLPLVGVAAGLFLNLNGVTRPEVFGTLFGYIVHIFAWFAVVPVGMSIRPARIQKFFGFVSSISVIKFIITPAFVLLSLLFVDLGDPLNKILFILAASPVAIFAVATSSLHRLNVDLSNAVFLGTTLIYLVVLFPVFLLIA